MTRETDGYEADIDAAGAAAQEHDREVATTSIIRIAPALDERVAAIYNEAIALRGYAERRIILTNEGLKPAVDDLSVIAGLLKAIKEKRKEYVDPIRDHLNAVNKAFNDFMEPLEDADWINRDKITAFGAEQKRKIAEAKAIEDAKLELARREMELKGEITVDLTPVIAPPPMPTHVYTDTGTIVQRDNWKWEVVEFPLVPDSYKMINAGVLTPIVKASKGRITILGIRIYNDIGLTVRPTKVKEGINGTN